MKRTIIILTLIIASVMQGRAQNAKQDNNGNYVAITKAKDNSPASNTGKTYTDSKGTKFEVFVTKNGKLFINRISKKTNLPYKMYLKL
jgi:uncharacterized protein YxeA